MEELIVKVLVGEASAREIEVLETWMAEAEENRKQVADFRKILEASRPEEVDVDAAWGRFQKRVNRPFQNMWKRSMAAAAVLAVVGVFTWWFQQSEVHAVEAGNAVRIETLADGSVITLNKHARITYREDFKADRKIELQGEAFFEVEPDPDRPFVIQTPDLLVKVLGTSFNVKSTAEFSEVIVESGKVQVENAGKSLFLEAGESLRIDAESIQKKKRENTFHQYYRTGQLVCRDTPLAELCTALLEIYGVDLVLVDPRLGERRITTVFTLQSLEETLEVIEETLGVKVKKEGKSYFIR